MSFLLYVINTQTVIGACFLKSQFTSCFNITTVSTDCTDNNGYIDSGIFLNNTDCNQVTTPYIPTTSCCNPDPIQCLIMPSYDCQVLGGVAGADNGTCNPTVCPTARGSCTKVNGTCYDNYENDQCADVQGFLSLGSYCPVTFTPTKCGKCPPQHTNNTNLFAVFTVSQTQTPVVVNPSIVTGDIGGNGDLSSFAETPTDFDGNLRFNNLLTNRTGEDIKRIYTEAKSCDCDYYIDESFRNITLTPGKHCHSERFGDALALGGIINFDGKNWRNITFIIYVTQAIFFTPLTRFNYTNGASPDNIIFISDGDIEGILVHNMGGTFISKKQSLFVYAEMENMKAFSLESQVIVVNSGLTNFVQKKCKYSNRACVLPDKTCIVTTNTTCLSLEGTFRKNLYTCRFVEADDWFPLLLIVIFAILALGILLYIICQSEDKNKKRQNY